MKSNSSIIALKDFENISNIRLSLARYSTALKGPEYKRKWVIRLMSDLEHSKFIHNMASNVTSNFRLIYNNHSFSSPQLQVLAMFYNMAPKRG